MLFRSAKLSFHNTYSLLKKVDQLPTGPDWMCDIVNVVGDLEGPEGGRMGEDLELWHRNPLDCIQELIGNLAFKDKMVYKPAQFFTDKDHKTCIIDEAWTVDWCGKRKSVLVYDSLVNRNFYKAYQKKISKGGVIAPVILASDKTQLTHF